MIKLTRTTGDVIWLDHRKIVTMFVEKSPAEATVVELSPSQSYRVKETPTAVIQKIRAWSE